MSEHQQQIPSWPERAARVTNAKAALAGFERIKHDGGVDWLGWAHRLAAELALLIPCIDTTPPEAGNPS